MDVPAPPIEVLLTPLDSLRSSVLRFLAPRMRDLVVLREHRVAVVGACLMLSALVMSSVLPLWVLAVGPILWGVPHVVSDVRYLIARPGLHRRPWVMVAIGAGITGAAIGYGVRGGLAGAAGAILFAKASRVRRAAGLAVIVSLLALAQWAGPRSDLVFAHAHNVIGVGLWWAWRRRAGRLHLLPIAIFATGCALILGGALDPVWARTGGFVAPWTGLTWRAMASTLSWTTQGPFALRLPVLYAFLQSAHYLVWVRLIPEDDRPSPTPRSFQQSFRALRADVGAIVLWIAVLTALVFFVWAAVHVGHARNAYIQAVFFHGHLELGAAAVLWAEGSLFMAEPSRSRRSPG